MFIIKQLQQYEKPLLIISVYKILKLKICNKVNYILSYYVFEDYRVSIKCYEQMADGTNLSKIQMDNQSMQGCKTIFQGFCNSHFPVSSHLRQ